MTMDKEWNLAGLHVIYLPMQNQNLITLYIYIELFGAKS